MRRPRGRMCLSHKRTHRLHLLYHHHHHHHHHHRRRRRHYGLDLCSCYGSKTFAFFLPFFLPSSLLLLFPSLSLFLIYSYFPPTYNLFLPSAMSPLPFITCNISLNTSFSATPYEGFQFGP
jgi:hypothetical protein